MSVKKDIIWRVNLALTCLALFACFILFKAIKTQFVEGEYYTELAKSRNTRVATIEAERGNILTENNDLMATSVPIYDLRMDCISDPITNEIFNANVDQLAEGLSRIFSGNSPAHYRKLIKDGRKNRNRYLLIQRKVNFKQLKAVRELPIFNLGRYKGGLIVVANNRREMPYADLAKRTVGYQIENTKVGIEGAFDSILSGVSGKQVLQKISGGVWKPIGSEFELAPENGKDIVTTIDINLQDIAQVALTNAMKEHEADRGCVVVMEVATGKIRAIANLKNTASNVYTEMFNYAMGDASEPGSTFKLPTLMAGFEKGYFDLNDTIDIHNGAYKFGSRVMKDSKRSDNRDITVQQVFEKSSNVGVARLVHKYFKEKPQDFIDQLKAFGVDAPLNMQIPGEGKPQVKNANAKSWSKLSLPWMSIGYEVALTPLQTLNFYNTIANNGTMMRPLLVSEIRENGRTIKQFKPEVIKKKICSDSTLAFAQRMLLGVVENGTATNLKTAEFQIAGKTGTAQIADASRGYKANLKYQSTFVGYFPADKPIYSCIVIIYDPKSGTYYGGSVAGPVFKTIAEKVMARDGVGQPNVKTYTAENPTEKEKKVYPNLKVTSSASALSVLNMLGMPFSGSQSAAFVSGNGDSTKVQLSEVVYKKQELPNLEGMGLTDAIKLLESMGLKVQVSGFGKVESQVPAPGSSLSNCKTVKLKLGTT